MIRVNCGGGNVGSPLVCGSKKSDGPKLIISDLDGTAVDMGTAYARAEELVLQDKEACNFVRSRMQMGRGVVEVYSQVCKRFNIDKTVSGILSEVRGMVRESINGSDIVMPGLREVFYDTRQNKGKVAIATNNTRENANMILHATDDPLVKYVNRLWCAGDVIRKKGYSHVTKPKPEADVFLACCEWFGVGPESALVLEDSISGIEAARNACIPVFVYYNGHNSDILNLGDAYITDYSQVDYSSISTVWNLVR